MQAIDMRTYGLNDHFSKLAQEYADLTVARVLAQEKGLYRLVAASGEKLAEVSGRFRYNILTVADYPAVGDFVMTDWNEKGGNAVIHRVMPRQSCFKRKAAGEAWQEQVIAANIDTAFLCMSLNNDFNLRRLERYLTIAWDSGAAPVVVLTKADLCGSLEDRLLEVSSVTLGAPVLVTTAREREGYEQVGPYIRAGKTVAFIGSSGVGKSTLINRLLGADLLNTQGLRNDDKGRHTTTRRELYLLPQGGMVVDTPGMRELGILDSTAGIDKAFAEIEVLTALCRFSDCSHSGEPGCAVQKALDAGELDWQRWQSYQKLHVESAYAENKEGYLQAKEQKFKAIAKSNKGNPRLKR